MPDWLQRKLINDIHRLSTDSALSDVFVIKITYLNCELTKRVVKVRIVMPVLSWFCQGQDSDACPELVFAGNGR